MRRYVYLMCALGVCCVVLGGGDAKMRPVDQRPLIVAVSPDSPPFCFVKTADTDPSPRGFEIDLINAMALKMGRIVQVKSMDFSSLVPAVQSGRACVGLGQIENTPERAANVRFSVPYYQARMIVLSLKNKPLASLGALDGQRLGVQLGSAHHAYVKEKLRPRFPQLEAVVYNRVGEMIQDLQNGRVQGVLIDEASGIFVARQWGLHCFVPGYLCAYYMILNKENRAEVKAVNQCIEALKYSGKLAAMEKKWLGTEPYVYSP